MQRTSASKSWSKSHSVIALDTESSFAKIAIWAAGCALSDKPRWWIFDGECQPSKGTSCWWILGPLLAVAVSGDVITKGSDQTRQGFHRRNWGGSSHGSIRKWGHNLVLIIIGTLPTLGTDKNEAHFNDYKNHRALGWPSKNKHWHCLCPPFGQHIWPIACKSDLMYVGASSSISPTQSSEHHSETRVPHHPSTLVH